MTVSNLDQTLLLSYLKKYTDEDITSLKSSLLIIQTPEQRHPSADVAGEKFFHPVLIQNDHLWFQNYNSASIDVRIDDPEPQIDHWSERFHSSDV